MSNPFNQKEGIVAAIENWNVKFPFDLQWRRKYNVPFGSKQHREMCPFDIKFDIAEAKYIDYIVSVNKYGEKDSEQLLKKQVIRDSKKEEIEKEFDDLDISEL